MDEFQEEEEVVIDARLNAGLRSRGGERRTAAEAASAAHLLLPRGDALHRRSVLARVNVGERQLQERVRAHRHRLLRVIDRNVLEHLFRLERLALLVVAEEPNAAARAESE